jgi:hypothetical protein
MKKVLSLRGLREEMAMESDEGIRRTAGIPRSA